MVEAAMFKPVGDAFVFRTPGLWPFRPARHYRVDAAQKEAILARLKRHRTRGLLIVLGVWLVLVAGMVGMTAYLTGHDDPTIADFLVVFVLALVLLVLSLQVSGILALAPLTAGLTETAERFPFRERLAAARGSAQRATPFLEPVLLGALYAVGCAANVFAFLFRTHGAQHLAWKDGASFSALFLAILLGGLAVRFFYLDFVRAKPIVDPGAAGDTEAQTDPLAFRLERMERESLRLRRALTGVAALASVVGVGAAALAAALLGPMHSAEANRFILRNSRGDIAALLAAGKDGSPTLSLYGPDKSLRMFVGLTSTGEPQLAFYGAEQSLRFLVGMARDGLPVVRLNGADGTLRVGLVVNSDDSWLTLSDPKGTTRLSLSAGAAGGHITILDGQGKEQGQH